MNFSQLIRSRRSIRRYQAQAIPPDLLEALCELASWSPSAHNRQPWRFVIIQEAATSHRLAAAMGERLRADLHADGLPVELIAQDVERSYDRITSAAALICLCLTMQDMDQYPDARRNEKERMMAVQSVAMAGQTLLLAAHDAGLGACWMCAPIFCADVVQQVLDLPTDWEAQGLVTLGYPAQTRNRSRHPIQEMLLWR